MNTLISNPKKHFLLGASLDILHHESTEWLGDIAFWKDELKFFDKLLKQKNPIEDSKHVYMSMLEMLEKIHGDFINQLEEEVREHESMLAKLEQNKTGQSDWDYREKHRRIKSRIEMMTNEFRAFKKVIFNYVKNL
jgi:hypothetical protein